MAEHPPVEREDAGSSPVPSAKLTLDMLTETQRAMRLRAAYQPYWLTPAEYWAIATRNA